MSRRLPLALLAAAVALAVAGCGGGDGSAASGDEGVAVVPDGALAYVSLDTDLDSSQWKALREHLDRFPDADRLVDELVSDLADEDVSWARDVEPALGPEVVVVALPGDAGDDPAAVVLTQPDDEAKLETLLRRSDEQYTRREIEGWQAIAEDSADLDAYAAALDQGTIEDDATFEDATADLPDEALLTMFVDGEAAQQAAREAGSSVDLGALGDFKWLSGAAHAVDEGVRFDATYNVKGLDAVQDYEPTLLDRIPSDAIAVASFKGAAAQLDDLRRQPAYGMAAGQVEALLGVTLDDLARLFEDEGAFYVRPSAPIPEATLLLRVDDEAGVRRTLDRLADRLVGTMQATRGATTLDGAPASYVEVQGFRVTYGVSDGVATVTTARALAAPGEGARLADSGAFGEAKDAAGLGDETAGFLYVDLERTVSLVSGFAGLAGDEVPPELERNLRPLRALVTHASRSGDEIELVSLLTID